MHCDFQNPHNICGFVGANEGVHTDRPISGTLPELPTNFDVEDWNNIPTPVQYICCSHRRMTQASHWSEENYRHYIAAFQHYTKMVSKQVDSVLKALYSTPAGKNTIIVILADHGDGMASHRMVTKHISFYDEMTNVPFIFAGPGHQTPEEARRPSSHTTDTRPLAYPLCYRNSRPSRKRLESALPRH